MAAALGRAPKTVRNWATLGLLARHGKDDRGRTLFSIDEALQLVDVLDASRIAIPLIPDVPSAGHPDAGR